MSNYKKTMSSIIILISLFNCSLNAQKIHIFGDSHASFCFRQDEFLKERDAFEFSFSVNNKQIKIPFIINWLGPITMHRIGRDGLQFLNIKKYDVAENDIVVFVFGEIDVRCHIGKQRDMKKRNLTEIIGELAFGYIETIKQNQNLYNSLTCVICSVVPPIDGLNRMNPEYPFYGELIDRVCITKLLNKQLKKLAALNDLLFLDIYDLYADSKGALNEIFADTTVHINYIFNKAIKEKLLELIES